MTESKLYLKPEASLKDYQEYVTIMVKERGFDKEEINKKRTWIQL